MNAPASGIASMNLIELLRSSAAVAQTGGSAAHCEALVREAGRLADMVGWAPGPIDPRGLWLERLATLQDDLRLRHTQTGEDGIDLLYAALGNLGRAIARHDGDLDAGEAGEDGGEDFT